MMIAFVYVGLHGGVLRSLLARATPAAPPSMRRLYLSVPSSVQRMTAPSCGPPVVARGGCVSKTLPNEQPLDISQLARRRDAQFHDNAVVVGKLEDIRLSGAGSICVPSSRSRLHERVAVERRRRESRSARCGRAPVVCSSPRRVPRSNWKPHATVRVARTFS